MILDINSALDNIKDIYPEYDEETGYEVAGFVWFQGWNDLLNWSTVKEYAFNLANLIRDVRKEVDTPDMPIIVGELGQAGLHPTGRGSDRHIAMREAERNVTLLPEFRNTSLFIPTAKYVVENGTTYNGGYHYSGRADTYFHIGKAFGKGMLQLFKSSGAHSSDKDIECDDPLAADEAPQRFEWFPWQRLTAAS